MSLKSYYNNLSESGKELFLARVGTTQRYFEYFIMGFGNNTFEKNNRFPRKPLLEAIVAACEGHVTYLEILCDLIPQAKKDLEFLLRVNGVAGGRPRPIETNASRVVNGDQSYTTSVDADQSAYGG
jgi:hypothetical protein